MRTSEDPIIQSFHHKVDERIKEYKELLAGGAATSMENYTHRVGQIKGLTLAKELLSDAELDYLSDDD